MKKLFVIMPFHEEYDDVYQTIVDSGHQASKECGVELEVYRADDISEPGVISIQVMEAIKEADLVIADITNSNPNVMYELGYAHALEKSVAILNQNIHNSSFNAKDFRQITYSRNRLVKDCRPRLVSTIISVIGNESLINDSNRPKSVNKENTALEQEPIVRRPGVRLVAEIQKIHLELQIYNKRSDTENLIKLGSRLRSLINTITIVGNVDDEDARNTSASIGNCAVEIENGEQFKLAEDIFKKGIDLFPSQEGIRLQYSNFLFDQGRNEEAKHQLAAAEDINPNHKRIMLLKMKFLSKGGDANNRTGEILRDIFNRDPSNKEKAIAYLIYLSKTKNSEEEFESVCIKWANNTNESERHIPERALADFFATQSPKKAIGMYEKMLTEENIDISSKHDILHNVAMLYADDGNKEKAIKSWKEAYQINKNDQTVNAIFSQRLASWGELDLAQKVINGQPIE